MRHYAGVGDVVILGERAGKLACEGVRCIMVAHAVLFGVCDLFTIPLLNLRYIDNLSFLASV